jgi:hypothetical protein
MSPTGWPSSRDDHDPGVRARLRYRINPIVFIS